MDERERSCAGSLPDAGADPEWAEYTAWRDGELAGGRDPDSGREPELREPEPWEPWDWESRDPSAGPPVPPRRLGFGQGDEADVLPPGPLLARLTEDAVRDLGALTDNELVGVLQGARRQEARETCKQTLVIAEFARRREAAFEAARARGVPVGCRAGGFPGEELAVELVTTRVQAGHRIEAATDLVTRLPATLAGMAAGLVDAERAAWIAYYTHSLSAADAARADAILAEAAPDLRADQLARKAAALEMRLDPAAARARKDHARRTDQRVEARREASGNASLSAREMGTADAMAAKSHIDAMAAALRAGGLGGPLGALRVLAMSDLTQGRNPLDRLNPAPADEDGGGDARPPAGPGSPEQGGPAGPQPGPGVPGPGSGPDGRPGRDAGEAENARHQDPSAGDPAETAPRTARRTGPAPLPALINLIVPAATLLGWGTAPAQAGTWGLLDYEETRAIVTAASRHPRTRWCMTLTNDQGEAIAHACAPGQHPWPPQDPHYPPDPNDPGGGRDGPAPQHTARLHDLLHDLNPALEPIARGTCDHAHAEDHYTPSRKLAHLVRARTATCDAPACATQATYCDLDHTVPYPHGPTDERNLAPRCRTHHRAKQAPDWKVTQQPQPGVTRWTLPSGRTRTTTPTTYDT